MSLLDTASLIVTPNGYKEGKLYSVIPSDGSGDMSVTRATTATRVNSAGLVELVPYNLLQYSQEFNNGGYWGLNNATITANNTTAPDGTLTADKVVVSANTDNVIQTGLPFVGVGNKNTISLYIKGRGSNIGKEVGLYIDRDGGGTYEASTVVGVLTAEWQRIEVTHTWVNSQSAVRYKISQAIVTTPASEFFIWGAQLVEGSVAKDYQKTETRLNIPRLDYSNGTCPSLLVEPQRTNLVTYSSSFDNAVWNKSNTTISANSAISPSGINDADNLVPNTSNAAHFIENSNYLNLSIGQTYTTSFYAKANGYNFIQFTADGGDISGNPRVNFNLSNGTLGSIDAGITASIQDVGNGWYRCVATYVAAYNVFNNIICVINSSTAARAEAFIGNGTDGVYLWGAQLEAGSYATSYIPTTSASVTRNADVISKTGISSLIGSSEYTLFWDGKHIVTGEYNSFATCYQASNLNNSVRFYRNNSNNAIRAALFNVSSGLSLDLNSGITTENAKCALRVKAGDYAFFVNGSLVASSTSALAPSSSLDALNIQYFDATQSFKQELKGLAFWKTALTNTQLAALTTI